jgi:thioredoxin reductase
MVIIATGANDNPPPIAGLAEHWGRGVFTCPYCDGFEHGDTHLAVTGSILLVPHIARILTGWSHHVTAFHESLDEVLRTDLVAHGVNVEERAIVRVNGDGNTVSSPELSDVTNLRSNMSIAITDGVIAAVDCNTALLDRDGNQNG